MVWWLVGLTVAFDCEWTREKIDVLSLAWDGGTKATAIDRTPETMRQFLDVLHRADRIVGQNVLDADYRQLEKEGYGTEALIPKTFDTRLAIHATHGHLAGTGLYDLRSIVLLLGGRQGERFPLDFKHYESDLHKTCAMDASAAGWVAPTLDRLITTNKLENTVAIAHRCAPIFARMKEQGVRLDKAVLDQIYHERKTKVATNIDSFGLWEERGKKKVRKVPIWRSPKVLDLYEQRFGIRPANLQRKTWLQLAKTAPTQEAKDFAQALVELGKGANDAHWLGKVTENEEGIDFDKVGDNGFIYPRYDICGSPDRAIASGPNIQNFPRPSDDPRAVPLRRAVVPLRDDHTLIGVDFSAVEMVTNAFESKDMQRVSDVLTKTLGHESTAGSLNAAFGLSLTRQQGKTCNHAMEKGESPYNLARRLFNTERPSRQQVLQCQSIFRKMLSDYPALSTFRDSLWERAVENPLVVSNSFGRRLACFSRAKYGDAGEKFAKHDATKKYWCSCSACAPRRDRFKYAIAFLGRSCAFDVLLRKMSTIWYDKRLDAFSLPYLEVHDSLTFSVPVEKAEHYLQKVIECFKEPIPELDGISLHCDGSIGLNWAACK